MRARRELRTGATIDLLVWAHRGIDAARRFFERAIELHGVPETITIDKSGANTAAVGGIPDNVVKVLRLAHPGVRDHRAI